MRCAAFGCNTDSSKSKTCKQKHDQTDTKENQQHFFKFPTDVVIREQWVRAMSSNRSIDGKIVPFEPAKHSVLCHRHFEDRCYDKPPSLLLSLGLNVGDFKVRLLPDAVPTIFPEVEQAKRRILTPPTDLGPPKTRRRNYGAYEKRNRKETINMLLNDYSEKEEFAVEANNTDQTLGPISMDFTDPVSTMVSRGTQTSEEVVSRPTNDKGCQIQPKTVETGMVALVKVKDTLCGPDLILPAMEVDESESEDDYVEDDNCADPDWQPDHDDVDDDEDEVEELVDVSGDPIKEPKYIVFDSCLMRLFTMIVCEVCTKACTLTKRTINGTCLKLIYICEMGHVGQWTSQPTARGTPLGNLLLSGSILFSGSTPAPALSILSLWNVATISKATFFRMQRSFGIPAVANVWRRTQNALLEDCRGRSVRVAGDARCCSPGHTAKYGSYTLMDTETGFVLAVELIQSNEVKNSNAMEMEGLKRAFRTLETSGVDVADIITDRHVQIRKYLREEKPDINHWFDVWHLAKNVKKKLMALSKKKGCEAVAEWIRSISNHIYFCAASSDGDGDMVEQKWRSILNHVTNKHDGHGDKFPRCLHDPIERKWIESGSKAHKELKLVVENKRLVGDIRHLSPHEQTSALEAQHKVVCQFAPKFLTFSYPGMKQRLNLAALHTCCNAERGQAVDREGKLRYKVSYPKYKAGSHVVKPVKEECSYEYVDALLDEMMRLRENHISYKAAQTAAAAALLSPPPVCSRARKISKEEAVDAHRSRFAVTMSRAPYTDAT